MRFAVLIRTAMRGVLRHPLQSAVIAAAAALAAITCSAAAVYLGMSFQAVLGRQGHNPAGLSMGPALASGETAELSRATLVVALLCALAIAVVALNMLNFSLFWVLDRRREAAIHAVVGAAPRQLRVIAGLEGLLAAGFGWVASVPLIAAATAFLPVDYFSVVLPALSGAGAGALAVGICVAVALMGGASRATPAELLRSSR